MALPSVQGYLLGTREPLDFVGKAIDAFTQVSAEMRATRAQNLAEQEHGEKSFHNMAGEMRANEAFDQQLIDTALQREYAKQDQQMKIAKFGADMELAKINRETLLPLKLETEKARIQSYQSLAASRKYAVESEIESRKQFGAEADAIVKRINEASAGPKEGQFGDEYYEYLRNTNKAVNDLEETWGGTGDKTISGFIKTVRGNLNRIPAMRDLIARGDTKTAAEREAIDIRRNTMAASVLPFKTDTEYKTWKDENPRRWSEWMQLDDAQFSKVLTAESTRIKDSLPKVKTATEFNPTSDEKKAIFRLHSAVRNGETEVNLFGDYADEGGIPLKQAAQMLQDMGIPSQLLPIFPPDAAGAHKPKAKPVPAQVVEPVAPVVEPEPPADSGAMSFFK